MIRRIAVTLLALTAAPACSSARGMELAEPVGVSTTHAAPIGERAEAPPDATNRAEPRRECAALPSFLFDTGSATIDSSQDAELQRIARCLTGPLAGSYVIAIGRADPVGGAVENMALGLERAAKIRQFLVARGVEERRVLATTAGERTTAASVAGRRVDLVVVPSLPVPPRAE